MLRSFIAIILFLIANISLACSSPKPGYGMPADKLINKAKLIVLAEIESSESDFVGDKEILKTYRFKILRTIKGKSGDPIEFHTWGLEHIDNDFNLHSDGLFWNLESGRSEFPCCICGPMHTFSKGYKYLLFPSHFGAYKSAEIINSDEDAWYRYVLERVGENM